MRNRLSLKAYNEAYYLDIDSLLYVEADDHYAVAYMSDGSHIMLPFGLSKIESLIKEANSENTMVRFGRKYIINIDYVFYINTVKQELQMHDKQGNHYSIKMPKAVLRSLMEVLGNESENK